MASHERRALAVHKVIRRDGRRADVAAGQGDPHVAGGVVAVPDLEQVHLRPLVELHRVGGLLEAVRPLVGPDVDERVDDEGHVRLDGHGAVVLVVAPLRTG